MTEPKSDINATALAHGFTDPAEFGRHQAALAAAVNRTRSDAWLTATDQTAAASDDPLSGLVLVQMAIAAARADERAKILAALSAAAAHPFKGPDDTDASMLREAAKRLADGYPAGGSNTRRVTANVLQAVANILDGPTP